MRSILFIAIVTFSVLGSCQRQETKVSSFETLRRQNLNQVVSKKTSPIENTRSSQKINDNVWQGNYKLSIDYGKLDNVSEMSIDYDIEISNDKCTFSGMGYKTYFTDLCKIEENGNQLVLTYVKAIDGDGFSDHSNLTDLGTIIYKEGKYYLKSSIVADKKWNYNNELLMIKQN